MNTGVGSLSLLQQTLLTQESNQGLSHCRRILYHLSHKGSPRERLQWAAFPLLGILPTQGMNPGLPHRGWILYQLSHKGSPRILEWVAYPLSSRSSWPRNWTRVSCIAGGFFTNWTIREALFSPQNCLISFAQSQNRAKVTGFISQTPCPIPVPAFLLVLGQQHKRTQGNFGGWNLLFWLW